jgi:hypothetical protein
MRFRRSPPVSQREYDMGDNRIRRRVAERRASRRGWSWAWLALLLVIPGAPVVGQGNPAPLSFALRTIVEENRLTNLGVFRQASVQGVTPGGQVMFLAERKPLVGSADQGLFLWSSGRTLRLIGRDNRVPGGKIRQITAAALAWRTSAARAFVATVRGGDDVETQALYVAARNQLRRIARIGDTVGTGQLLGVRESGLQVNAQGEVLLLANLDLNGDGRFDPASEPFALFLYTGGKLKELARTGGSLLDGRITNIVLGPRAINGMGRVAWEVSIDTGGVLSSAVVVSDRGQNRRTVRSGDRVLEGRLLEPRDPVINEPGNVAFVADLAHDGGSDADETGVFLFRPRNSPPILTLARSSRLERGHTLIDDVQWLNDFNQAAVDVLVDTNASGNLDPADERAIYLAAISGVEPVARGGRELRVDGELRGGELVLGKAMVNNQAATAVGGFLDASGGDGFDPETDEGVILFAYAGQPVLVARDRQTFSSGLGYGQLLHVRGPDGITEGGVIVFTADLDANRDDRIDPDDEGRAIFLAIPRSH